VVKEVFIFIITTNNTRGTNGNMISVNDSVGLNSNLSIIFDENIRVDNRCWGGQRGIYIYYNDLLDGFNLGTDFGNFVEFIPFTDAKNVITGTDPLKGLTANKITFDPDMNFERAGNYVIRASASNGLCGIEDYANQPWAGVNDSITWGFTVSNDVEPILAKTNPAYKHAIQNYFEFPADPHGYVIAPELSMEFTDNGNPVDAAVNPGIAVPVAPNSGDIKIYQYIYKVINGHATYDSLLWDAIDVNADNVHFAGNKVTITNEKLRDNINGNEFYYVIIGPGVIRNAYAGSASYFAGIDNAFVWRFKTGADDIFVDEPKPLIVNPLNGALNLPVKAESGILDASHLIIEFGEGIEAIANPNPNTTPKVLVYKVGDNLTPVFDTIVTKSMISGNRLTVPVTGIKDETNYYVQIQANAFADTSTSFTGNTAFGGEQVWAFQTGDNTAPKAVTKAPVAGCVKSSATITMTFNESKGVTKGAGTLTVKDSKGTEIAHVDAENILISEDGNTVTATIENLPDTTTLTVTVPAGFIFDKGNNVLPNALDTWTFRTGENTPPTVVITPAEVLTPDAVLTLTFSEVVVAGEGAISVTGFDPIPVDSLKSTDGGLVYKYTLEGLSSESTYEVVVPEGAFLDKNNGCEANKLAETSSSFTVGDILAPVATGSPKTAADYVGLKLDINFTDAVTPATGNIEIYDATDDTEPIETIDVTSGALTASAGNTVYTFAPTKVKYGQYYILIDAGAFVDSSAAPIGQVCAGISSKAVWPLSIVDENFDPCFDLASMKPARAEQNVDTTTTVVIKFCTERLAPGVGIVTIGSQDLSIPRELGKTYFEYHVTSDMIDGSLLTIPVTGLQENTTYSIIIQAGAITDEAGNSFIGITDANSWIFTTGDFTDPVVSVDAATVIGNDGLADPIAITSNEAGRVYLVKDDVIGNETAYIAAIAQNKAVVATLAAAGTVSVNAEGLKAGNYKAYGFDASGRKGTAANIVIVQDKPVLVLSKIKQIQGTDAISPVVGQRVRTQGVVTLKLSTGFYMQDANAEWSGIFVSNTGAVSVGQSVEIIGTVSEVDGLTTIGAVEGISYIAPVITVKPLSVGPAKVMTENYEGVLVKVTGRVAASGTVTADWTISSAASLVYTINNAVYGTYSTLKDYKYEVTGIGIPAGTAYKVLATEIVNASLRDNVSDLSNAIKVYPNPFDKFITLSVSNNVVITKAVITNIAGQLVKEVINPNNTITTSELRSGVYFISLHTVDGIAKTERIIKR